MHRLLERFASSMTTLIMFLYLGSLFMGTAQFFIGSAANVESLLGVSTMLWLGISVGAWLAFAVECHAFLSLRKTRSLVILRDKTPANDEMYDSIDQQFHRHLWITIGLVIFSMFNAISFWIMFNRPTTPWEYFSDIVRGVVIPLAFICAGFLTPLTHDAGQVLADAAHGMLHMTTKVMTKQWNKRIKQARKRGVDLAPIAIALMQEEGDTKSAKRISIIAQALDAAERGLAAPKGQLSLQPALTLTSATATLPKQAPQQPPMELDSEREPQSMAEAMGIGDQLFVTTGKPTRASTKPRATRSSGASKGSAGRKPYPKKDLRTDAQKEADCRRIIAEAGGTANISGKRVAALAKVSGSTGNKWWHAVAEGR